MEQAHVQIQTTITGYKGAPCTLLSVFDKERIILAVAKIVPYREQRVNDASIITNTKHIERDAFFEEKDLKGAIHAYKTLKGREDQDGSHGVEFFEGVSRADPAASIESDGVDVSGEKFRISSDISNEQIAVLATCFYAEKIVATQHTIDLIDGINDAYLRIKPGDIWTI